MGVHQRSHQNNSLLTGLCKDELIGNDLARREIDEVITEVFGDEVMGFQEQNFENDPFESSSDEDEECHSVPDLTSTSTPLISDESEICDNLMMMNQIQLLSLILTPFQVQNLNSYLLMNSHAELLSQRL